MQTNLVTQVNTKVFSKSRLMIALDFYDGPVSGVMRDLGTNRAWKFTMIDWDDRQEVRVFATAPLPEEAFKRIADTLSEYESPKSPFWFPLFNYPNDEIKHAVERKIDEAIASATGVTHVIATSRWGDTILAERSIERDDLAKIQPCDSTSGFDSAGGWLELFGLERSPKE